MPIIIGKPPSSQSGGGSGTDHTAEIAAIQAKDISQDGRLDIVEQTASSAESKADTNTSDISSMAQRVTTLENIPAGTDYSAAITAVQDKNTSQDTRLGSIDAALINKAPLVSGKVPYENLPEFPVGRKLNVANKAARLALSSYADLTIAYESDTGDAYGLDAGSDPAIDANWSKLGNTQGIGVASFNGRTGNIGPQTGDYTSNQIAETTTKVFVTPEQKTDWTSKETTTGSQTKATTAQTAAVASAKSYADSTFIPLSQKNAASGVAPLDANSKVPVVNLLTNVAGGVPTLDTNNRVPSTYLYRNGANGIAGLDANSRVLPANLPTFLPQSARIWRDASATKVRGQYYTNSSGNEMQLHLTSNNVNDGSYFNILVRQNSTSTVFNFVCNSTGTVTGGAATRVFGVATIPIGWEYSVSSANINTRTILAWFELS